MRSFFPRGLCAPLLAAVAALGTLGSAPAQAGNYDMCGTIEQGVTCPKMFRDDGGMLWLLGDYGGFDVGDTVRVTGQADPGCISICQQGNGCIAGNTISDCTSAQAYCSGDGSATPCPCGNTGAAGAGCDNSFATGGARLTASGIASVAGDTLVLSVTGAGPTAPVLYFQGTSAENGGQGLAFGDGLRCVGGSVVRLRTKTSSGGASSYPEAGDPSVSQQGGLPAGGGTFYYQAWYRNTASFCTSAQFNLSNGLQVDWTS